MTIQLDRYDEHILHVLGRQGRISVTSLAAEIGLSKSPTQARIKRLEDIGVITGYRAMFDAAKLGADFVVFVEVTLSDTSQGAVAAFAKAAGQIAAVEACHQVTGDFTCLMKLRLADVAGLADVMAKEFSALPHVTALNSYIVTDTIIDDVPMHGVGKAPPP